MQRHIKLFTTHIERKHESELRKFVCRDNPKIWSISKTFHDNEETSIELNLILSLLRTLMFQHQVDLGYESKIQGEELFKNRKDQV